MALCHDREKVVPDGGVVSEKHSVEALKLVGLVL